MVTKMPEKKVYTLRVRLSQTELDKLRKIAEREDKTLSEVVRTWLRNTKN